MSNKALLAGILPFITNPAVLVAAGIGAVGITLYKAFSEQDKENGSEAVPNSTEPLPEPSYGNFLTAPQTVALPLETVEATVDQTVHSAVEEPLEKDTVFPNEETFHSSESMSDEDFKKEMIRQTMPELGKRSAAARARRKNTL